MLQYYSLVHGTYLPSDSIGIESVGINPISLALSDNSLSLNTRICLTNINEYVHIYWLLTKLNQPAGLNVPNPILVDSVTNLGINYFITMTSQRHRSRSLTLVPNSSRHYESIIAEMLELNTNVMIRNPAFALHSTTDYKLHPDFKNLLNNTEKATPSTTIITLSNATPMRIG